jgi:hypothetical protein
MKHFLALLLASVGLMLTPSAAFTQDTPGAPAEADAQSSLSLVTSNVQVSFDLAAPDAGLSPATIEALPLAIASPTSAATPQETVINLPPPPFQEYFLNAAYASTLGGGSNLKTSGLQVSPFASFIPAAAQIAAKTGVDGRFALEFGVAAGFAKVHDFTLVAEFPVVFNPNGDVKSGNLSLARSYSSLFFTPALRIMYAQDRVKHPGYPPVYPWFSLGGGLAHFSPSAVNLGGGISGARSSTEGALQAGAGVDIGIYRKSIALRAEVRDFYTGPPNLGAAGINLRHNVVASAGIVFRCCWRSSDQKSSTTSPAHN